MRPRRGVDWRLALAVAACLGCVDRAAAQRADPAGPAAQIAAEASAARLAESAGTRAGRPAGALGWECLALLLDEDRGKARPAAGLRAVTTELLRTRVVAGPQGSSGWTVSFDDPRCAPDGGHDAFGDGTCNPPGVPYAVQTGLATACLALASLQLDDPAPLEAARAAFGSWRSVMLPEAPCAGCAYFPVSPHPNDRSRYVRNMNVFMALAGVALGVAGDEAAGAIGRQALASELAEQARGNRGYLGVLDRQHASNPAERERIENHAAAESLAIAYAASLNGDVAHFRHALDRWRTWAECDNERCRRGDCRYWAADAARCQATHTAVHCAFRHDDPRAATWCANLLARSPALGAYGVVAWRLGSIRAADGSGASR